MLWPHKYRYVGGSVANPLEEPCLKWTNPMNEAWAQAPKVVHLLSALLWMWSSRYHDHAAVRFLLRPLDSCLAGSLVIETRCQFTRDTVQPQPCHRCWDSRPPSTLGHRWHQMAFRGARACQRSTSSKMNPKQIEKPHNNGTNANKGKKP
jgi:hypothetical protein